MGPLLFFGPILAFGTLTSPPVLTAARFFVNLGAVVIAILSPTSSGTASGAWAPSLLPDAGYSWRTSVHPLGIEDSQCAPMAGRCHLGPGDFLTGGDSGRISHFPIGIPDGTSMGGETVPEGDNRKIARSRRKRGEGNHILRTQ